MLFKNAKNWLQLIGSRNHIENEAAASAIKKKRKFRCESLILFRQITRR